MASSPSLVEHRKTAVIIGGTLGIGAAIARCLAKLGTCTRIIIFGRDEARAEKVLEDLRELAPKDSALEVELVKGDLSDKKGMLATVEALQISGGVAGIDYLVMCQKGLPTGTVNENSDGYDTPFAIQAISRFALAYLLTKRGALAPGAAVMSIAATGESLDDLSVEDLSLSGTLSTGISKTALFLRQSKRDSSVLDAFHEELNIRYPSYRYYHLSPGLVSTEHFDVNKFPGIMKYAVWMGQRFTGHQPHTGAILLAPPSKDRYFDSKLNPKPLGRWAAEAGNREALWKRLVEIFGEED
ncbi:hypothetical protein C8R46DRAFT_1067183 [Mycena filopes]|nr:hypothetical protein C8R46DRAFT_1067183 [Mycena filopes]